MTCGGIVASFPTAEAVVFLDALGMFGGGEFRQVNIINIHGIRVFLGVDEGGSGLEMTTSQGFDMHLLCVEHLCFLNPVVDGDGDKGHGKDHSGNTLVYAKGKLIDECDVVGDSGLACKVLEVSDVFLESIVSGSIKEAGGLLDELG